MEGFDRRRVLIAVSAVPSASFAGLDTTPAGLAAEAWTAAILLAGVAILGYLAVQVVDSIEHGIIAGVWKEKKRRRMLEQLSDHIIVCGYGRGTLAFEEIRLFERREALAT